MPIAGQGAAQSLKGSPRMGDGSFFLKNLRALLFNDDLSNEPTFRQIHLAGQFLLSSNKKSNSPHLFPMVYLNKRYLNSISDLAYLTMPTSTINTLTLLGTSDLLNFLITELPGP